MKDDPSSLGARLIPLGFRKYAEYLASDHWVDLRRRYRESDLPQTCKCGATRVALHHVTYVRLGAEELPDLEPLCNPCHRKVHGKRRRRKYPRGTRLRQDPSIVGVPFR